MNCTFISKSKITIFWNCREDTKECGMCILSLLQVIMTKIICRCSWKWFEARISFNMPVYWCFRNTRIWGLFLEQLLWRVQQSCCSIGTFFMTFGWLTKPWPFFHITHWKGFLFYHNMIILGGVTLLNLVWKSSLSMWIVFPVLFLSCTHVLISMLSSILCRPLPGKEKHLLYVSVSKTTNGVTWVLMHTASLSYQILSKSIE